MSELYEILKPEKSYFDRSYGTQELYQAALLSSTTVYVGNLSFFTTQDSIRELFSNAGKVNQIIMGINDDGHPCGFCFVVFQTHEEAGFAVEYISKTKLNDRIIRVDWDPGYKEGRQKGRGNGGQQRREDFRTKQDAERPKKRQLNSSQDNRQDQRYQRKYDHKNYDRSDRYDKSERFQRNDRRDDRYSRKDERYQKKEDRYDRRDDRYQKYEKKEQKYEKKGDDQEKKSQAKVPKNLDY